MKTTATLLTALMTLTLLTVDSEAKEHTLNLASYAPGDAQTSSSLRFDLGASLSLGAAYALPAIAKRPSMLSVDIDMPFGIDTGDVGTRAAMHMELYRRGQWAIQGSLAAAIERNTQRHSQMHRVSASAQTSAGYLSPRWFVTLDLEFESFLGTKIAPTAEYRRLVHAEAEDNWFAGSGGLLRPGISAGMRVANIVDVGVSMGLGLTQELAPAGLLPLYGGLTVATRF